MADTIQVNRQAAEAVRARLAALSATAGGIGASLSCDLGTSVGTGPDALEGLAARLRTLAGQFEDLARRADGMVEDALARYAAADADASSQFD